jgi:multidrug efflux pump subunit AcrA (membrane-fusion protein)
MPPVAAPTHPYDNDVAGAGIVEPASEVIALAIERGGVVTRVDVVAGDVVKAGQPLFSIDARNYQAAVAQDEAAVAAESAAIASIEQSIILQQDAIDQAGANLDSAEAERTRVVGPRALRRSCPQCFDDAPALRERDSGRRKGHRERRPARRPRDHRACGEIRPRQRTLAI